MDSISANKISCIYCSCIFIIFSITNLVVSIIAGVFMMWLFISEFSIYLSTNLEPELTIDTTRGQKLKINFEIRFPNMPCGFLSVDAIDKAGEHQLDVDHSIVKNRMDSEGNLLNTKHHKSELRRDEHEVEMDLPDDYCGSCYGAETKQLKCCNTCDQVQEAYRGKGWSFTNPGKIEQCSREGFMESIEGQKDEGCVLYGNLEVNKVAGNFHFAPGRSYQKNHAHLHDSEMYEFGKGFNLSHTIVTLSFGTEYPGREYPLDSVSKIWNGKNPTVYQYFIKVVPTIYEYGGGEVIDTNQFSVTEYERKAGGDGATSIPGVYFHYDLSPIKVHFKESSESFASFITGICAIIGGIFTVSSIIDSFIFHSMKSIEKKMELGKFH
eukprot:TRINITY_DN585_c0_g1_i2.p1 TRINITY_DN585_c0_g1~~TRINITY_DN585_c0_g1_i2.p1  ORF type:complete len:381 (-),score=75.74 TRINITY_DN585_c0_g1_i2:25-1167(-)